jgi:hypothetical protein
MGNSEMKKRRKAGSYGSRLRLRRGKVASTYLALSARRWLGGGIEAL